MPAPLPGIRTVGVVGAGAAGLAAVKLCLEQGLAPTAFEQHDHIGGIWNYSREPRPNQGAAAFHNLIMNTCRDTSGYTDFPIPHHFPDFLPHSLCLEYMQSYAEHFQLLPHIKFNTRVTLVQPSSDFSESGRWHITSVGPGGESTMEVFDSVIVCSGMQTDATYPNIPGQKEFKGSVMHMIEYRTPNICKDKRVLVIGNQHSAGDIACDAASCAKQVYLSLGEYGTTLLHRLTGTGHVSELRFNRIISSVLSVKTAGGILCYESKKMLDYEKLGVKNGGNPLTSGCIMINDDLRYKLTTSKIISIGPVKQYTEKGVIVDQVANRHAFISGSLKGNKHYPLNEFEVDMIVLATGYRSNYNFIDVDSIKGKDFRLGTDHLELYKGTVPVHLHPATLMFGHAIPVLGPHIPAMEMRIRWIVSVFTGRCMLPSLQDMKDRMQTEIDYFVRVCKGKKKIMSFAYSDMFSRELGCFPKFWTIFCSSPILAWKVYSGPRLPSHYRLVGRDSWSGAARHCSVVYDALYPRSTTQALTIFGYAAFVCIFLYLLTYFFALQ